MSEKKVIDWFTMNGKHIPIYEGESKQDALNRSIAKHNEDKKQSDIEKSQAERDRLNQKKQDTKVSKYEQPLKDLSNKEFENIYLDMRAAAELAVNEFRHHQSGKHPLAGSLLDRPNADIAEEGKESQYKQAKKLYDKIGDSLYKKRDEQIKLFTEILDMSKTNEDFNPYFRGVRIKLNHKKK